MRQKFVFILLGGGMDGLAALRPDNDEVLKAKRPVSYTHLTLPTICSV